MLSAILGWAGIGGWNTWGIVGGPDPFGLLLYAVFGLPIALLSCWLIGGPVIRILMRKPVSWLSATAGGAGVAAVLALPMMIVALFLALGSNGQVGYGDYTQIQDGMLTAYGLQVLAQNVAIFVAIGAAVGLFVRAAIGPGRGTD
jgi:hypothetical protein